MDKSKIPGNDVKSLLDIYSKRLEMMNSGITNPPESVKLETAKFVNELKKLNENEYIKIVNNGETNQFIVLSTNKIIATYYTNLPNKSMHRSRPQ